MPCSTKRQKHLKKICEAKKAKRQYTRSNIDIDNVSNFESYPDVNDISFHDELKGYDNIKDPDNDNISFYNDNFSIHDELIENDNAISIIKKLQEAAKKYHQEHASQEIHRLRYIGNSSHTKRRKNQQQREAAKGTLKLHIFWNVKKSTEEIEELDDETNIDVDDNADEQLVLDDNANKQLDNEVKGYNWYNKIPDAFKSLMLDIKKEKINSEVWVCLNSIRLYFQLVKSNHPKMQVSEIVADAAGKGTYHAKCIRSWAREYIKNYKIPYFHQEHHAKIWSFL